MKKFMAFWAIVRRFKAFLTVGLLMPIPIVNVLATWCYAANHLDNSHWFKRVMHENIVVGLPAFDKTTQRIWTTWLSETLVVLSFALISVTVNDYTYAHWPERFDYSWITNWNLFYWYQLAAWALSGYMITSALVRKLNAIYSVHRHQDPEYMDEADITEHFMETRKKNIEERKQKEGWKTKAMQEFKANSAAEPEITATIVQL
jgi:hypothetical protein